jgi:hypothetical protein
MRKLGSVSDRVIIGTRVSDSTSAAFPVFITALREEFYHASSPNIHNSGEVFCLSGSIKPYRKVLPKPIPSGKRRPL